MPKKIIDLEVLKSFRQRLDNRYVQQIGYIPELHVGLADLAKQIENVSEESGDTQTKAFILQATATDSNTTSTPTAPLAKHLELRGNSVVFNQLARLYDLSETTTNGITISINATTGTVKVSGTAEADVTFTIISSVSATPYNNTHTFLIKWNLTGTQPDSDKVWTNLFATKTNLVDAIRVGANNSTTYTQLTVKSGAVVDFEIRPQIFDLSLMFVDIPTEISNGFDIELGDEDETILHISGIGAFNQLFRKATYPFNTGELMSCDSTNLTTIGFNQFDGVLEGGSIDIYDGDNGNNSNNFRTKNYISVIAGQKYTFEYNFVSLAGTMYVIEYDGDNNFIKTTSSNSGTLFLVLTENTQYVRIQWYKNGSNWRDNVPNNANVCCNLTWDKSKTGYEEYSKHEYDLPTLEESLISANKAYDELSPNGSLTIRIEKVDIKDLINGQYQLQNTSNNSGKALIFNNGYGYLQGSKLAKGVSATTKGNIIATLYQTIDNNTAYNQTHGTRTMDNIIDIGTGGTIKVLSHALDSLSTKQDLLDYFTAYPCYIQYELETPTTTQNDAYAYTENIVVDDFGTMEFNSIIPQGNRFFYPADYVLLLDDLNNYINSDITNLVKQSDLESATAFKTLSSSNIGSITSTTISTGWYKNVIFISGGLTNARDVKVKMSNGYTYTPTGFSVSEIVIFSGVDFSTNNITVDTIYFNDN